MQKFTKLLPASTLPIMLAAFATGISAAEITAPAKTRRILYNLDGDSCLTLKAGRNGPGPMTTTDLTNIVAELTRPGSQVDTLLDCVNAQVMYYPTQVGTMRGALSSAEERGQWPAHERQRFENMQTFFNAGVDPYAVILGEAKRRGREALLTFRMNDAHGNDFLRTAVWRDHPEFRLGNGALDFTHDAVRDYVFHLIEEAVQRYDCDGLELDFQRFPTFFRGGQAEENIAKINGLVERVRRLLDAEGAKRGRRLILAARPPSDYGQGRPTYEQPLSLAKSCDPAAWARHGWIDFLCVSEFLFTTDTLDLKSWRQRVPEIPIYGAIQPETKPSSSKERCEFCIGADGYRKFARERWADGADGIYLFNFFTTREWAEPIEPPLAVLTQIGDPGKTKVFGPTPRLVLPGTENFTMEGRPAFVFMPPAANRTTPQPWVFYAPTLPGYPDGAECWMHEQFLAAGIAVAGVDVGEACGSPRSHAVFDALHRELTGQRGFAAKPCLLGRSRGGLWVTSWAIANPHRVAGLAGIYPVFDFRTYPGLTNAAPAYGLTPAELAARAPALNPVARLDVLAKARVPALLLHGDVDTVVPLRENSGEFVRRYREAGVESLVKLIVLKGQGHSFYEGFFLSQELVDFVAAQARAGAKP